MLELESMDACRCVGVVYSVSETTRYSIAYKGACIIDAHAQVTYVALCKPCSSSHSITQTWNVSCCQRRNSFILTTMCSALHPCIILPVDCALCILATHPQPANQWWHVQHTTCLGQSRPVHVAHRLGPGLDAISLRLSYEQTRHHAVSAPAANGTDRYGLVWVL